MSGYQTISSQGESQEALLSDQQPIIQPQGRRNERSYASLPKRTTKDGKISTLCSPSVPTGGSAQLSQALMLGSATLDLGSLDLSNIDPCLASDLLEEIRLGADLGPIVEKIRKSSSKSSTNKISSNSNKESKVVTFQDETIKR